VFVAGCPALGDDVRRRSARLARGFVGLGEVKPVKAAARRLASLPDHVDGRRVPGVAVRVVFLCASRGVAYAAPSATRLKNAYRQLVLTIGTRPQRIDVTSSFLVVAADVFVLAVLTVIAPRLRGSPLP
jgi:hypothetical protein